MIGRDSLGEWHVIGMDAASDSDTLAPPRSRGRWQAAGGNNDRGVCLPTTEMCRGEDNIWGRQRVGSRDTYDSSR